MAVRCKEMTERLKIIEDQEIEAIEAINGGLEFELAACNLELLNKVGRPGGPGFDVAHPKLARPCLTDGLDSAGKRRILLQ